MNKRREILCNALVLIVSLDIILTVYIRLAG